MPISRTSSGTHLKLDQTTPQSVVNGAPVIEAVQFDTTPSTSNASEGLLRWNDTDGTLDLGVSGGDITMQVGQELYVKVRNASGYQTINNGQVVYISGRTGVYPDVQLARSDAEATSTVLGIATQDITSPGFGYVTTFGYVRGIKTDYTGSGNWGTTWATGDKLYVSKTVAGQLTNAEPAVPHHSDVVGTVGVIGATQGSILVINGKHYALQELTDINGTSLNTTGQIPVWNNANGYFDFSDNITNYTALPSMGEISYFSTTGTGVVISAQSDGSTNMVACSPPTTLNNERDFDNGGSNNGRLRYIGATSRMFHVACTISISPAGANDVFVFGIAKNGTVVAASKVLLQAVNASQPRSTALHLMLGLTTNDYVELYVGNTTNGDDVTILTENLFAMGM